MYAAELTLFASTAENPDVEIAVKFICVPSGFNVWTAGITVSYNICLLA